MRSLIRVLPLLAAAALAACSDQGDVESVKKDVAGLRADLQRVQKDNEKITGRLAAMERRLGGVAEDIGQVRQLAVDVKPAAAPKPEVAAAVDGAPSAAAPTGASASSTPEGAAIRTYLGTEEGKKALMAAVQAERDERDAERAKRGVDARIDRFAKDAGLTADQTKRMKDIMERQAEAMRGMFANLRDLGPDASVDQRDGLRQQDATQAEALRKQVDDQLRNVLSQAQYDQYQQSATKMRGAGAGAGVVPGAAGGNGRRNRGGAAGQSGN